MGKSPILQIGDLCLQESGAITQYLLKHYDTLHQLLPRARTRRAMVQTYVHAAKATCMVPGSNGVDIEYIWAMDWLDAEIGKNGGRYLIENTMTAADAMMAFGMQYLFAAGYLTEGQWGNDYLWLDNVEFNVVYQRAVGKTGFHLNF